MQSSWGYHQSRPQTLFYIALRDTTQATLHPFVVHFRDENAPSVLKAIDSLEVMVLVQSASWSWCWCSQPAGHGVGAVSQLVMVLVQSASWSWCWCLAHYSELVALNVISLPPSPSPLPLPPSPSPLPPPPLSLPSPLPLPLHSFLMEFTLLHVSFQIMQHSNILQW